MRDDLLHYYERELTFLRRTGVEFARRYPKVASRLLLEPNKSEDPHVERLLEGFAFLAARVHLKIDDDFPEISEALLNVVYPHYTRPIPSMSLVEFQLDPEQGKLTTGLRIPRESLLYSRPVGGVPCKFRTCYETMLWPLTVAGARWMAPHELHPPVRATQAVAALRLELRCLPDVSFAQLELETLRLHISAEAGLASTLYELLLNSCVQILVRDPTPGSKKEPVLLPPTALRPVGFGQDEGMLPFSRRSFIGYRLLQEYFTFPDKYLFLDLGGFERVRAAGLGERAEVVFLIAPFERSDRRSALEAGVSADTFRLGCAPIVNLFPQTSEPVLLNQRQHEYLVIPDARRRAAIGTFSIEEVAAVTVRLTGYNGDLPSRLPFGNPNGDFEMPGGGPIQKVVALVKPTAAVEPPLGKPQLWRLISQLSLNYMSLIHGGAERLQELLRLHNFADSASGEKQIQGILAVTGTPRYSRIESEHGLTFARGHRVEIDFDEEEFAGGSVYLLASVLERFLGLYVSLNSFCILAARTRQRKQILKEWPPRAGWKALL